jgi:hypothetical protein
MVTIMQTKPVKPLPILLNAHQQRLLDKFTATPTGTMQVPVGIGKGILVEQRK